MPYTKTIPDTFKDLCINKEQQKKLQMIIKQEKL